MFDQRVKLSKRMKSIGCAPKNGRCFGDNKPMGNARLKNQKMCAPFVLHLLVLSEMISKFFVDWQNELSQLQQKQNP